MPILFGDSTNCSRLIYWGILLDMYVDDTGTEYTFGRLNKFGTGKKPQDLVLKSTGKNIAPNYIRPYAICRTPSFII